MNARALFVVAVLAFSACSHASTGGIPFVPQARSAAATPAGNAGTLLVHVTVHRDRKSPHYLSPSSKGMTVDVKGPTTFEKTVGLTVRASGCESKLMTLQCALRVSNLKSCPTSKACYAATIRTYDAYAHKKIPPRAHLLSAIRGFKFTIGTGTTVIPLVLDGIPASVAFIPSENSALTGTQKSGFVFPKCTTAAQTVTLIGVDADGNYIVGPGSAITALKSNDTPQLRVAEGPTPNAFSLHPPVAPAYAYGSHTVVLTAAARPVGRKLGRGTATHVKVTYSGDICGTFTEFTIPTANSQPYTIAPGPDGSLWIPELNVAKIARLTTAGVFTEFPVAAASQPVGIVAGPDGNMWFTENGAIGKMTTAGKLLFEKPTAHAADEGIAVGSDGNIWFVEDGATSHIAAITTDGTLLPEVSTVGTFAFFIASGPDGALWFTETGGSGSIGRVTTSRSVSDYPTTTTSSVPYEIVSAHGALWFAEVGVNKIGRIDTAGNVTSEYTLPEASSSPWGIAAGLDGAIWFTEFTGNRVGRLALDGTFHEYAIPTVNSKPQGMTVGPDGSIWFVEFAGNKVGRLR